MNSSMSPGGSSADRRCRPALEAPEGLVVPQAALAQTLAVPGAVARPPVARPPAAPSGRSGAATRPPAARPPVAVLAASRPAAAARWARAERQLLAPHRPAPLPPPRAARRSTPPVRTTTGGAAVVSHGALEALGWRGLPSRWQRSPSAGADDHDDLASIE